MSEGQIFDRHRKRGPKATLMLLLWQSPFVLGTMAWASVALGLSLFVPVEQQGVVLLAGVGWLLTLGQFRSFRITLFGEVLLFLSFFAAVPSAAEWISTGLFLSFLGRGLSRLAMRFDD